MGEDAAGVDGGRQLQHRGGDQLRHVWHDLVNLSDSALTGSIPDSISLLTALKTLFLPSNALSGPIPNSMPFGLQNIYLDNNRLEGSIPGFGFTDMYTLYLSSNKLSGAIPNTFTSMVQLRYFSVEGNNLSGPVPLVLGALTRLQLLKLGENNFTGTFPLAYSRLTKLSSLSLNGNSLSGELPDIFWSMTKLSSLNLDGTNLSGPLPKSLGSLTRLQYLNIDGTNLTCPRDKSSCGFTNQSMRGFCQACPSFCSTCTSNSESGSGGGGGGGVSLGLIIGICVASVVILLLLLAVLLYVRHKMQQKSALGTSLAAAHCTEFALDEVLKATNDWSDDNLLGSGAFGDVYKGVSPRDGTTPWAVKRAKLIDMDFQREILQMADKNHPNIVRLLGFAVGGDVRSKIEQILIYEFVPNGDLDRWIGPKAPSPLSLKQRLDILIGIARGYEYLHSFDIVHRDIKPANVLITSDMQPKIADFGLVRVGEGTTVGTTRIMGTPGYVDPVYSRTSKATTASDVYSFGVLMLVVLTGRPPLAEDAGETKQITPWASECLSSGDIASLKPPTMDAPEDAVLQVAQLAVSCTMERTAGRPSMGEVAAQLQAVREEVAGKDGHSAAIKVDAEVQEMKDAFGGVESLEAQLQMIGDDGSFITERHV